MEEAGVTVDFVKNQSRCPAALGPAAIEYLASHRHTDWEESLGRA